MAGDSRTDLETVYLPLRLTYGLIPVAAGLDKFTNLLVDWQSYLPSYAVETLPIAPATFMQIVGVIEIVAGLTVLTGLTRLGGVVVAIWLALIAAVAATGGHYDIAVRDVAMAVGAYTLAQVARLRGDDWLPISTRAQGRKAHAGAH
jgi:uncharacterized membrane protein YphA (DoxX/SURF4 family)